MGWTRRVSRQFEYDVCVVGGGGHVGFPLAVAFASRGLRVGIYDINASVVETINAGRPPFLEPGVVEPLAEALAADRLVASTDRSQVSRSEHVVMPRGDTIFEAGDEVLAMVTAESEDEVRQILAGGDRPAG